MANPASCSVYWYNRMPEAYKRKEWFEAGTLLFGKVNPRTIPINHTV